MPIPPLESGDRLSRAEFERRYNATPEGFKAELINGVVYVASPVRIVHGRPHATLMTWLGTYWTATPGTDLADNTTTRLDLKNEPQPDALLRLEVGGSSSISDNGYIEGAPELVAEVAASIAAIDLGDKKTAYKRNGVREYLVWQVFDNRLDWYCLQDGKYLPLEPDADGIIRSLVFPGLWLAVSALLEGDRVKVLAVLELGLNSPEYIAFLQHLYQQR
ncbi:Uma2 family endonuclease [Scytonema sp. NUACC26]|uniref:Uma2 family endonuclease n=1 Tax=Scytonema sp. NUACC26 TaxID=3140176 RepID=UPI0034DC02D4